MPASEVTQSAQCSSAQLAAPPPPFLGTYWCLLGPPPSEIRALESVSQGQLLEKPVQKSVRRA